MIKKNRYILLAMIIAVPALSWIPGGRFPLPQTAASAAGVATGGGSPPRRNLLLKSASQKNIVETARNRGWSIGFEKHDEDSLLIIALRVEFEKDTSALTTGNGLFGGIAENAKEKQHYSRQDYKYDNLKHDSAYFDHQLAALRNYYSKVSRGKLDLAFSIYPAGGGETGYRVPKRMTDYSPGWKRKEESTDEYWDRKTGGLMTFVKDAIKTAADPDRKWGGSPFNGLRRDDSGILRDINTGRKAVILILHAGASYMTDGGQGGEADSPSDMIDAFINQDYFKYYKGVSGLDSSGIPVDGNSGEALTIDEVMMCAETSNQDGLNWGIQGILVNQLARQLGIPDLFSTSGGMSAVGAFCVMDFAGYSAGQGFIPPYPSAWVRAFMGWDKPYAVGTGTSIYSVKALTSVLDRADNQRNGGADTTILLLPLNNNEYYLVENRQRNLSDNGSVFNYETGGKNIIRSYPFNVNIGENVEELSKDESQVILKAKNNDVSLPASGVLVWHVDERVIRQKLAHNLVNADSSYRGVRLVEADGINDLGVTFTDAFYQAAFDYGGAEDVFPHKTTDSDGNKSTFVDGLGPYTRPSTRSNDGGHTYLGVKFGRGSTGAREEKTAIQDNTVVNYSDSVFTVNVTYDYLTPGWPRRAAPEILFFDPLVTELATSSPSGNKDTVLALLSDSGRLYLYPINGNRRKSYGDKTVPVRLKDYHGNVDSTVTVTYFDSIPGAFVFPTAIGGKIYVPAKTLSSLPKGLSSRRSKTSHGDGGVVYVYSGINHVDTISLPAAPSSYVCGIGGPLWAIGLTDGRIITGDAVSVTDTVTALKSDSPARAIAVMSAPKDSAGTFAVMQDDGTLSIIVKNNRLDTLTKITKGIPPFTLVTGDLDNDGKSEIIVSDSRQGLWVYTRKLTLAPGWREDPNDWANAYYVDPQKRPGSNRDRYPMNRSAPALADLNRDGYLDIVVSGINGIYALNRKGALLSRWPAYLDNRYWYQRGSVTTSPIAVSSGGNGPLVLFSSPTGERATFAAVKIKSADKGRGMVTFYKDDGTLDSLWDLSAASIDTILTIGDSLIYPYVLPGGFVDALNADASRPVSKIGSWPVSQSRWPLSTGSSAATSPLVYRPKQGASAMLFAVSSDGMVYSWNLSNDIRIDSLYWPQNGFNAARGFAYGGPATKDNINKEHKEPVTFWNYPNPTIKNETYTTFKYRFGDKAKNVRLDIHTITGRKMDTFTELSGDFPDWNEWRVNLRKYGPGIYRCRMEAEVGGKKYSKFWKMAVVK